jgi:hypothetical protein
MLLKKEVLKSLKELTGGVKRLSRVKDLQLNWQRKS